MSKKNFLLGKGERLIKSVLVPSGGGQKHHPYLFEEAKQRVSEMLLQVVANIIKLPTEACPDDNVVATITLHPSYIAKSYFPSDLLRNVGLEAVGSKDKILIPKKSANSKPPQLTVTTQLFVKGTRKAFKKWSIDISNWTPASPAENRIIEIEEIEFPNPSEKIVRPNSDSKVIVYEVVLHASEEIAENGVLSKFKTYLKTVGIEASFERRFYARGLCFTEIQAPLESAEEIATFSLVRALRKMPSLRLLKPIFRNDRKELKKSIQFPLKQGVIDQNLKVAIFDGGVPDNHEICQWVTPYDTNPIGDHHQEYHEHGIGVTSAFLFGHINPEKPLEQPYAKVDHYRVLDSSPSKNEYELFEVLDRIMDVLNQKHYDLINLSLGPNLPIEDNEVHAWTAVLDEYLSKGTTLATIAVGNDGEGDPEIKANRVQVPSDCVNAMAIGACDSPDDKWKRASYSSIGPGRSPGLMKPDLVDFGGSLERPFLTLSLDNDKSLVATGGTSFSSPSVLRQAAGIRAYLGPSLSMLAIRTLLVHCSEKKGYPNFEVGWGKVQNNIEDIITTDEQTVRVVFQGTISASKYVRVPIPLPLQQIKGDIKISATLCFATPVDPHYPNNYTRSGLEVFFRPNKNKLNTNENGEESLHAKTSPFFNLSEVRKISESELRKDAMKWENCIHDQRNFRSKTLVEPTFDIHYSARSEGHNDTDNNELQYALVISVHTAKVNDLYDQVVRRFATQLEPLKPVVDLPIRL
jgi:hypothetical protein